MKASSIAATVALGFAIAFSPVVSHADTANKAGTVFKDKQGKLMENDRFWLVKKVFKKGEVMKKHNHPGSDVIFTVLKGKAEVTLNDSEKYELVPGEILHFNGTNYIQSDFPVDSEVQVILVHEKK